MKNASVESNNGGTIEQRKKQRAEDSEFSPIETVTNTNESFLSYSSHSTPLMAVTNTKTSCPILCDENSTTAKRKRKYSEEDENYCYFKSEIDSILKCPVCQKFFDQNQNLPKMMCDRLTVCLECAKSTEIKCKFCDKVHSETNRTNSTILALVTIRPMKINSEELVFKSKCQKIIRDSISLSDKIGSTNCSFKFKLENLCAEVKSINNKSDLKQMLDHVSKIKQSFVTINETLSQIEPVLLSKDILIESTFPVNDNVKTITVYFDFDSLQDRKWFYPINKKIFFCIESASRKDLIENKLKIIDNKQELINQKLVKNFSLNSTMVSFDSKNFIVILNSDERQIICLYEIEGSFQNLKFVNAEKKIIYFNQNEIMIYVEKKKCITVLDHEFNKKSVFGQLENEEADFYLPKNGFELVFANKDIILIRDLKKNCLKVMERNSGKYIHSYFVESVYIDKIFVDKASRLVMVHKTYDTIDFLDLNLKQIKRVNLELISEINECFITYDNHLAFVNFDKCFIIFVKL